MEKINQELLAASKMHIKAVTVAECEKALWATLQAVRRADPSYFISLEDWLRGLKD